MSAIILNANRVPESLRAAVEGLVQKHYHQPVEFDWQAEESSHAVLSLPAGLVGARVAEWDLLGDSREPASDPAPIMLPLMDREILEFVAVLGAPGGA